MFGTYRLILAFMVVFLHLAGWPGFGEYAVFTFFCLSGYLMTFIMQQNYGYDRQGTYKYLINRLLRIYPLYFATLILSSIVIIALGSDYTTSIIFNLDFPTTFSNWFGNLLLIITDHKAATLVPPAWALTVEVLFYLLIGLGVSRTVIRTIIWCTLSVIYTIYFHWVGLSWWDYGYFHPFAASLPFSVGALLYHLREPIKNKVKSIASFYSAMALYGLVLINWYISYQNGLLYSWGFYINFVINILLLAVLTNITTENKTLLKWDKFFGDLSYPIYLIHWTVAVLVMYLFGLFGITLEKKTEIFAIVSIPFMLLFGYILVKLLHKPVELLRDNIKGKQS